MKLLIQPGAGVGPLVKAIDHAKSSVEIVIFRFDRGEIERALARAVKRGVFVHALIAYTNRGGEKNLRKLEMRLLAAGVTVARTADGLSRYHSKYLIVDRRELLLLAFNFTRLDIEASRSFGIITSDRKLVQEAAKLFDADTKRQDYNAESDDFVVSPTNARQQLATFIKGAKKELLIYDPEVSDSAMIRLLVERLEAGVDVKIIGKLTLKKSEISVRKLPRMRLHTRSIIRDRRLGFIGSQSLRKQELDSRREVGVIFRETKVVKGLCKTFDQDWELTKESLKPMTVEEAPSAAQLGKKVAKAVAKELPPVAAALQEIVNHVAVSNGHPALDSKRVKEAVTEAVKEAVTAVVVGEAVK